MDKGCHHGTRAKGALPPLPTELLSANLLLLAFSPNLYTSLSNPNLPEHPVDCFRPPTQWPSVVLLACRHWPSWFCFFFFSHAWSDFHFVFRTEWPISKTYQVILTAERVRVHCQWVCRQGSCDQCSFLCRADQGRNSMMGPFFHLLEISPPFLRAERASLSATGDEV